MKRAPPVGEHASRYRCAWREVFAKLDSALDIPPGDRAPFVARVQAEDPELAAHAAALLADQFSADPAPVAGNHTWSTISAGQTHSCGVTTAGEAYCWGMNFYGEIGNGSLSGSSLTPTPVVGGLRFSTIAAGAPQSKELSSRERSDE